MVPGTLQFRVPHGTVSLEYHDVMVALFLFRRTSSIEAEKRERREPHTAKAKCRGSWLFVLVVCVRVVS